MCSSHAGSFTSSRMKAASSREKRRTIRRSVSRTFTPWRLLRPRLPGSVTTPREPLRSAEGRRDSGNGPVQELLDRRQCHRRELEVRALADVESPRAREVLVVVVDQLAEVLGPGSQNPVLLQRLPFVETGVQIEESEAEGPEQPLVAYRH